MIQTVNYLNCSFFACFSHLDSRAEGKAWTLAVVCRKMHFCQPGNPSSLSFLVVNGKEQTLTYYFVCMKMEPLEQMVDITAKLFECDRDEMYSYIIRLCSKSTRLQMFFLGVLLLFHHRCRDLLYLNVPECVFKYGSDLLQSEVPA